jgi:hypothetical protein
LVSWLSWWVLIRLALGLIVYWLCNDWTWIWRS